MQAEGGSTIWDIHDDMRISTKLLLAVAVAGPMGRDRYVDRYIYIYDHPDIDTDIEGWLQEAVKFYHECKVEGYERRGDTAADPPGGT